MSSINEDSDQENVESNNNKDTFDKESPNKRRFLCFNMSNDSDEQKRLGQHPALPTLLRLSFGPLCSQIVSSMYLIVDSFWVSHTIGADGLTATGVVSLLETMHLVFIYYHVYQQGFLIYLVRKKMKNALKFSLTLLEFHGFSAQFYLSSC